MFEKNLVLHYMIEKKGRSLGAFTYRYGLAQFFVTSQWEDELWSMVYGLYLLIGFCVYCLVFLICTVLVIIIIIFSYITIVVNLLKKWKFGNHICSITQSVPKPYMLRPMWQEEIQKEIGSSWIMMLCFPFNIDRIQS